MTRRVVLSTNNYSEKNVNSEVEPLIISGNELNGKEIASEKNEKERRKHFLLFGLFIINGRIKKITSFQTLDCYVFNHKHFGENVGDNDCHEKHKNCTKTKAIAAKTIIVMSTTDSEGNYQTITYKENYLFPDVTIQTWLARLLTFFTQQRTLLTVLGLGLRKIMQFERYESLNFLISLTDNFSERNTRRYLLLPPFRNPPRSPFD